MQQYNPTTICSGNAVIRAVTSLLSTPLATRQYPTGPSTLSINRLAARSEPPGVVSHPHHDVHQPPQYIHNTASTGQVIPRPPFQGASNFTSGVGDTPGQSCTIRHSQFEPAIIHWLCCLPITRAGVPCGERLPNGLPMQEDSESTTALEHNDICSGSLAIPTASGFGPFPAILYRLQPHRRLQNCLTAEDTLREARERRRTGKEAGQVGAVAVGRPAVSLRLPNHHNLSMDEMTFSSGESSRATGVGPGVRPTSLSSTAAAAKMVAMNEATAAICSASTLGSTENPADVKEAAASSRSSVDGEGTVAGWTIGKSSDSPGSVRLDCGSGLPAHSNAVMSQCTVPDNEIYHLKGKTKHKVGLWAWLLFQM